jgi:hypothetical protein
LFYSVLSLTSFSSPKISKNDQINSIGPETYYHTRETPMAIFK